MLPESKSQRVTPRSRAARGPQPEVGFYVTARFGGRSRRQGHGSRSGGGAAGLPNDKTGGHFAAALRRRVVIEGEARRDAAEFVGLLIDGGQRHVALPEDVVAEADDREVAGDVAAEGSGGEDHLPGDVIGSGDDGGDPVVVPEEGGDDLVVVERGACQFERRRSGVGVDGPLEHAVVRWTTFSGHRGELG